MIAPDDDQGYAALTRRISRDVGLSLAAYKEKCLRRRLAVRMRACGAQTYTEYLAVLDRTPAEYERLKDALTINVTKFYRNPETWDRLRRGVLPELMRERRGHLRVWSAGCASGEEPFTLAMIVADIAGQLGHPAWLERVTILATDIDAACLARAAGARYADTAFSETPPDLVERFTSPVPEGREVAEALRRRVRFAEFDLTGAAPPVAAYDLVVCRNVVIYFDRPMQERLFADFAASLVPGGFLVLGKVETLVGPARERLTLIDPRERIYQAP